MINNKKPIIIQGALKSEIDILISNMDNIKKKVFNGFTFFEGTYNDYPIVISKTKIGEICSSIATTLGIINYNPILIINQGTAGAYDSKLKVNDFVIGENVYYISDFSTKSSKEIDEVNPWKKDKYLTKDNEIISYNIDVNLLNYIKKKLKNFSQNIYYGTICSGDIWTKSTKTIMKNKNKYGGLCEAMEVSGCYFAANTMGSKIFSIRIISNNEINNETYNEDAGIICQKFVLNLLDSIIEDINKNKFNL